MQSKFDDLTILIADDDPDDRMMAREALEESLLVNPMDTVEDGEELLAYLRKEGKYEGKKLPGLILLDLNMPRMSGREALEIMRNDERFRSIPVVVLTTSKAEEDIIRTYQLGVNSFITKPVSFDGLVDVMKTLGKYWFQIVELPGIVRG